MSVFEETIYRIRAAHIERCYAMEQRKRADLSLGAYIRTQLGWSLILPPAERKKIEARARKIVADPAETSFESIVNASKQSAKPMADIEKVATKEMERLAETMPIWNDFGVGIRGFGARSLAVIIGEAGDLGNYSTHSKLWKRMGLAVMDGVRQGGLRKTATKETWIAHGYSAVRRSRVYVIGDALIKSNGTGRYRSAYLARKQYERDKAVAAGLTVAPAAKIPAKRKHEFMSEGHVHARAQRYMEKRLLRDLWKAWRAVSGVSEKTKGRLPAEISDAPSGAVSATVDLPDGLTMNADTTNSNAPQGAGEAKSYAPNLANAILPPQTYVTVEELDRAMTLPSGEWEFIEPSEEEIATGDPAVLRKLAFPDMMNKETGDVVIAKWENIEPLLRLADELGELQIEEWKPTIN